MLACSFFSHDTFPGWGRWTDRLPLVEGRFTPDGASVIVADVAGQVGGRRSEECGGAMKGSVGGGRQGKILD